MKCKNQRVAWVERFGEERRGGHQREMEDSRMEDECMKKGKGAGWEMVEECVRNGLRGGAGKGGGVEEREMGHILIMLKVLCELLE